MGRAAGIDDGVATETVTGVCAKAGVLVGRRAGAGGVMNADAAAGVGAATVAVPDAPTPAGVAEANSGTGRTGGASDGGAGGAKVDREASAFAEAACNPPGFVEPTPPVEPAEGVPTADDPPPGVDTTRGAPPLGVLMLGAAIGGVPSPGRVSGACALAFQVEAAACWPGAADGDACADPVDGVPAAAAGAAVGYAVGWAETGGGVGRKGDVPEGATAGVGRAPTAALGIAGV